MLRRNVVALLPQRLLLPGTDSRKLMLTRYAEKERKLTLWFELALFAAATIDCRLEVGTTDASQYRIAAAPIVGLFGPVAPRRCAADRASNRMHSIGFAFSSAFCGGPTLEPTLRQ